MKTLFIDDFLEADEYIHLARHDMHSQTPMHDQDFYEIMIIESGIVEQFLTLTTIQLKGCQVYFVEPKDQHTIQVNQVDTSYINIAFRCGVIEQFQNYYLDSTIPYWGNTKVLNIDSSQIREINDAINNIGNKRDYFTAYYILFELCRILRKPEHVQVHFPTWLNQLLVEVRKQENFMQGVSVLAKLSNRSSEHISRELKKHIGMRPSDLIHEARMEYAVHELCFSSIDITELAIDCGYLSLAQFYSTFKKYTGMSPAKYRKLKRSL